MTIYITELVTGLLVIAGLFIWGRAGDEANLSASQRSNQK